MPAELYDKIDVATSGDNAIVAALAINQVIRVLSYVLMAGGTVNVAWRSGTTKISGAFPLTAQSGVAAGAGPWGPSGRAAHMETAPGAALNLNLDGNVQVSGHVTYEVHTR